jgi:hypothetical protein
LESPARLKEKGLDFCDATRRLVEAAQTLNVSYAFATDLFRSYLYDARTEELLLEADSAGDFSRTFGPLLAKTAVEQGDLDEIRRQPRSYVARQLRDWRHQWTETLSTELKGCHEGACLAVDRLLVLRFLLDRELLKRPGKHLKKRFHELIGLASNGRFAGCGRQLVGLFHDVWLDWKADLFAAAPALDTVLENDSLAAALLHEFSLLSRTKFTIPAILESFNYGDASEKARVRMIPEEDEERDRYLATRTLATVDEARIEVDLEDEGYRAVFYWLDRLIALYEQLEAAYDYETVRRDVLHVREEGDLDLFAWSEQDARRPRALHDKYNYAVERGLVLYYASPRQYRTARLMLYLYLIDRYDQTRHRLIAFPRVTQALIPRPRLLHKDRHSLGGIPGITLRSDAGR